MVVLVDDPDDPRLAIFRFNERGLTNRTQRRLGDGDGLFAAEGDLVVERALAAGCEPVVALVDAEHPPAVSAQLAEQVEVFAGGERLRAAATRLGTPNKIIAIFRRPRRLTVDELVGHEGDGSTRRLVLAEAVDNPVNMGSIIRNAAGLGWDGLVIDATSADPLARRSTRVSMGHSITFPHARTEHVADTVDTLRDAGFVVAAMTPAADAVDLRDVESPERIVLCVGSERAGLEPTTIDAATLRVKVPMHRGVDSLNVAAATAIACWALGPQA